MSGLNSLISPLYPDILFIRKDKSIFMKICNIITWPILKGRFNKYFWTTSGNIIYYPATIINPFEPEYGTTILHEFVHVKQYKKYGFILFNLLYFIFPLPILFSGRWYIEREAYCEDIKAQNKVRQLIYIESIINILWKDYVFIWPKFLMRKWFKKKFGV